MGADRNPPSDGEPNLGGKFLYVGELDERSRALVVAGNVAGAATLAATADVQAQKEAIRDGVVDFLVTSLDEALRILKNEIRKHERVAVCVGLAPGVIELEMRERGVQPDLVRSQIHPETHPGATTLTVLTWTVDSAPAHWLPKLDAVAIECLGASQLAERRWLRLAPRHLGRLAYGMRMLSAGSDFASRFVEQVQIRVESGEIATPVTLRQTEGDDSKQLRFTPR